VKKKEKKTSAVKFQPRNDGKYFSTIYVKEFHRKDGTLSRVVWHLYRKTTALQWEQQHA